MVDFEDLRVKRSPLTRSAPLSRSKPLSRGNGVHDGQTKARRSETSTSARRGISPASRAQRNKVRGQVCIVCAQGPCDPAHVIPRSLLSEGQDDVLAVVALCRLHHEQFDRRAQPFLNLLPFLAGRPELDFAIKRYGYDRALWRISNVRP